MRREGRRREGRAGVTIMASAQGQHGTNREALTDPVSLERYRNQMRRACVAQSSARGWHSTNREGYADALNLEQYRMKVCMAAH